jgi:hypothetical protein
MSEPDARTASVANEIARYLDRRPDASDTEDGIIQWWIPRIRLEEEMTVVRHALALLVTQRIVERVVLSPTGLVMFRRLARNSTVPDACGRRGQPRNAAESTEREDAPPCL